MIKSVRLNTYLRECILDSVLLEFQVNHFKNNPLLGIEGGSGLEKAIKEERKKIVSLLWDKAYGKYKKEIMACPKWARSDSTYFKATLEMDSGTVFMEYTEGSMPCSYNGVDIILTKDEWASTFAYLDSLKKYKDEYIKERSDLKKEIEPILASFGSTKQLLETWPSMEKFLPPNIADPDKGVKLPALSLSRLEEKINGFK